MTNSDKELGHKNTVRMKIDTDEQTQIKLKPYRTPIQKRLLVEGAVRDMLELG